MLQEDREKIRGEVAELLRIRDEFLKKVLETVAKETGQTIPLLLVLTGERSLQEKPTPEQSGEFFLQLLSELEKLAVFSSSEPREHKKETPTNTAIAAILLLSLLASQTQENQLSQTPPEAKPRPTRSS